MLNKESKKGFICNQEKTRMEIRNLVQQAKSGSKEASEELLARFKPLIYATVKRHYTGSDWEDPMQSAALSILEGIQAYDPGTGIPFPAYIKTKLNFDIYNLCRKERNIVSKSLTLHAGDQDPLDFIIDDRAADPQGDIIKNEQTAIIRDALEQLEPKYREVVTLYFFHKLTLKKIAKQMGVSYKTAQRYKEKAVKLLAEILKR